MKAILYKDKFAVVKADRIDSVNLDGEFFAIIRDRGEITVVLRESELEKIGYAEAERDFRLITFDLILPFDVVGFIAKISTAMADENISIFVISSYSTDSILIREKDLDRALRVLKGLGFEIMEK
ncbi:hypothetical protein Asulf_00446 [Archaeoglobus sulfaticallidus PM70-1]|uniref:CASTOR ACT domain-containing protein n=1 Tax=Archaeoglobus sulfaticallidus PM70-1 TaxID=387631 RepID=N0BBV4_9EURY|nr:ACT domain-containing protein [Archaeoglobus sulfaticallidus]AGK60473.1 hypothetical protein Asulf_00446 [Archaeoglobus sulfaticallidus PM70-1]